MTTSAGLSYDRILRIIRDWPPETRLTLAQDILADVASQIPPAEDVPTSAAPKDTLSRALGLLRTASGSTPSDTEIDVWLEERRREKYIG